MKVTAFFVFISLLLMLWLNLEEVESRCYPNGCSIPWDRWVPYKTFFRRACNKHDVCYACGKKNGWTRGERDSAFHQDMTRLCQFGPRILRGFCNMTAEVYYKAVSCFASSHYEDPSLEWCKNCPKFRGGPNRLLHRLSPSLT